MEIENTINIEDFMPMFVSVSFLQEQRFFNLFNLKSYLSEVCGVTREELEKIDSIIDQMVEDKMIDLVTNSKGLFKISKHIPFRQIVLSNQNNLTEMINFFYNYNAYDFARMRNLDKENVNIKK